MPFSCCFGGSQRAQRTLSPSRSSESDETEGHSAISSAYQQELSSLARDLFVPYSNQQVQFSPPSSSRPTKRLVGRMTVGHALNIISEQNPEAMQVLGQVLLQSRNSKALLKKMDDAEIYGHQICDLHNHVGSEDYTKTFRILLNLVNNRLTKEQLKEYIAQRKSWSGDLGLR